jgi:(p)ppGpp synthase/HD superfamily hydrolase
MSYKLLAHTIAWVSTEFKDKIDKAGQPYALHCMHVMLQMPANDPELRMIAVMHDLIEDTDVTFDDLYERGYSERVIRALMLLTHDPDVEYDRYIQGIATNKDARRVKLADLRHNSDIMRMKGLRKKDFDRLEKYHRSYAYLSEV